MRYLLNYLGAIAWAIVMLVLMGAPSNDMPSMATFAGFDKLAHTGSFFVLTVFLLQGFDLQSKGRMPKAKAFFITLIISVIFAFATEALQYYMSAGRQADWWDIFADFVGVGMALFSYLVLYRRPRADRL